MNTHAAGRSSARSAPLAIDTGASARDPKLGEASGRKAAKMQRAVQQADIAVITHGHTKVAKHPGAARILTHLANLNKQIGPALERAQLIKETFEKQAEEGKRPELPPLPTDPKTGHAFDPMAKCRGTAFAIEIYMRTANKFLGAEFKQHFVAIKKLEDELGAVGYAVDMLSKPAAKTGAKDIQNYWAFQVCENIESAIAVIRKDWLPKKGDRNAIEKAADALRDVEWPEGKHDHAFNARALAWEAEHVIDAKLDMNVLNEMHSLRRKCRKVSILASAMNGACVLTDKHTPKEYRAILGTPAADKPFAKLAASPSEKNPVEFSRGLWVTMSEMIEELGQLKDNREELEAVEKALRSSREMGPQAAKSAALAMLGHAPDAEQVWIDRAKQIQKDSRVLFTAISAQLREQV